MSNYHWYRKARMRVEHFLLELDPNIRTVVDLRYALNIELE